MNVTELGAGPALLLLHGAPMPPAHLAHAMLHEDLEGTVRSIRAFLAACGSSR